YSKWKSIVKLEALDDYTLVFHLKKPSAIFMSRVLTAPMVSEKEWGPVAVKALAAEKPLRALQDHPVENPLGTGPFYLAQYKKGAFIHMKKNPHFFGKGKKIGGHDLGPYVDHLLFRIYGTSDVAILALKKGDIDYYWWEIQPGYIKDLKGQENVALFFNKKSALYYLGFNLRRAPFNDKHLRWAVATLIDKDFILTRILQNYGTSMNSIVPSGNHYWYNPNVKRHGWEMGREARIKAAYEMLAQAGYTWEIPPVDNGGRIVTPSTIRMPSGQEMDDLVILTPPADYDPKRAFAGTMIQEWVREVGIPVFSRPMAFNALLDTVKGKHAFDAFVLGYGKLNLDPDYLRAFFFSKNDKPRGWNMSGYNNPEFDQLANRQRGMIDMGQRREVIWKMQAILMEDLPYFPLYNPHIIEAVVKDRYQGWVEKVDGIGNIWSMCMVRPVE
ncbi:MAG: ABC transporter substrate-binding protein, partial [Desulfobacterales bacterium]|nr:ABC transporter substrate-binding protein [Desulfobacterales bacterium]